MKWKEKQTEKGVLKYRMPDIGEGMFFLSLVQKVSSSLEGYRVKGKFVEGMADLVDWKALGYKSYLEFKEDVDNNFHPMSEIADEIFVEVVRVLGKKNSSSTPSGQQGPATPETSLSNS